MSRGRREDTDVCVCMVHAGSMSTWAQKVKMEDKEHTHVHFV